MTMMEEITRNSAFASKKRAAKYRSVRILRTFGSVKKKTGRNSKFHSRRLWMIDTLT